MKTATIVSTRQFDKVIEGLLPDDELAALEFAIAVNPEAHPIIPGTGGVRKARWLRPGMGKRGGIRVIYYYIARAEVVGLIAAYAKNVKGDLTSDDKKAIRGIVQWFEDTITWALATWAGHYWRFGRAPVPHAW